jgi:hypothetical protein
MIFDEKFFGLFIHRQVERFKNFTYILSLSLIDKREIPGHG